METSTVLPAIHTEFEYKRLRNVLRHIQHVRDNCEVLGLKLIESGEDELGRNLIANGLIHDNSKFYGIEWLYLHEDVKDSQPEKFHLALMQHSTTNPHHPEYSKWGCIQAMPRLYLAEAVCDWYARSFEFGTDLKDWIRACAVKKFKFSINCKIYKEIKEFVDLLLEKRFS